MNSEASLLLSKLRPIKIEQINTARTQFLFFQFKSKRLTGAVYKILWSAMFYGYYYLQGGDVGDLMHLCW